jgi:hypothetical protein
MASNRGYFLCGEKNGKEEDDYQVSASGTSE